MIKHKIAEIKKILCGTCCAFGWEDCMHFDNTYCFIPQLNAILALIAEEQKPLVEALEKIRDDFVPDRGQQELALEEMRECADTALKGVRR